VTFLEQNGLAIGGGDKGVVAQTVNRQFDFTETDFQLAAFTTGQDRGAEMIADLELEPGLSSTTSADSVSISANVDAFGILLGDVNET
jgi:hypothetical protein